MLVGRAFASVVGVEIAGGAGADEQHPPEYRYDESVYLQWIGHPEEDHRMMASDENGGKRIAKAAGHVVDARKVYGKKENTYIEAEKVVSEKRTELFEAENAAELAKSQMAFSKEELDKAEQALSDLRKKRAISKDVLNKTNRRFQDMDAVQLAFATRMFSEEDWDNLSTRGEEFLANELHYCHWTSSKNCPETDHISEDGTFCRTRIREPGFREDTPQMKQRLQEICDWDRVVAVLEEEAEAAAAAAKTKPVPESVNVPDREPATAPAPAPAEAAPAPAPAPPTEATPASAPTIVMSPEQLTSLIRSTVATELGKRKRDDDDTSAEEKPPKKKADDGKDKEEVNGDGKDEEVNSNGK